MDIPGIVTGAGIVAILFIAGISYISRLAHLGATSKGTSATTMGVNTASVLTVWQQSRRKPVSGP